MQLTKLIIQIEKKINAEKMILLISARDSNLSENITQILLTLGFINTPQKFDTSFNGEGWFKVTLKRIKPTESQTVETIEDSQQLFCNLMSELNFQSLKSMKDKEVFWNLFDP